MIPDFSDDATFGEILSPGIDIAMRGDPDEVKRYLEEYLAYLESKGHSPERALRMARDNLGYFAGYYGRQERDAVRRTFGAIHPVFGHEDHFGRTPPDPTPEELFEMGKRAGEQAKE